MFLGQWVKKNKEWIEALALVVSAVGMVLVAIGIGLSVYTMKQQERAMHARTHFEVYKFAYSVEQGLSSKAGIEEYLEKGVHAFKDQTSLQKAMHAFSPMIRSFYMVFRQYELGTYEEGDWGLAVEELCRLLNTPGGMHYFDSQIKGSVYHPKFKGISADCLDPQSTSHG